MKLKTYLPILMKNDDFKYFDTKNIIRGDLTETFLSVLHILFTNRYFVMIINLAIFNCTICFKYIVIIINPQS